MNQSFETVRCILYRFVTTSLKLDVLGFAGIQRSASLALLEQRETELADNLNATVPVPENTGKLRRRRRRLGSLAAADDDEELGALGTGCSAYVHIIAYKVS